MGEEKYDITTQVVHAGERKGVPTGMPVSTPVYTTATFTYESMEEVDKVFAGDIKGYVYTRYGNPTVAALEDAVSTLELGAGACGYSSGMSALHAALFACELSPGMTVLASQDLYGATLDLLYTVFGSQGIKTVTADFSNLNEVKAKADEFKPRALVAEIISNPLLKVCDLEALAEISHNHDAKLIVDNTFASPYLCQPIKFGADFVVHSATKYLGGHADTMGGITVARDEVDLQALIGIMKLAGGILGVWEAHEILRGLKTLALRIEKQCSNAAEIASRLSGHPKVERVYYPALAGPDEQATLKKMLRSPHAGAIVSIVLKDNSKEGAFKFMNALKLCIRLTSLGDVFTGVLHPATASHREMAPARRKQLGITDGLVRISIGIENVNDLLNDIVQALDA